MVQNFCFQGNRNSILNCNSDYGEGFPARFSDSTTGAKSTLLAELNPNSVHTPLVREYSVDIQYQFAPGWVLDLGYVGSSGINLNDYNHDHNQARHWRHPPTPTAICARGHRRSATPPQTRNSPRRSCRTRQQTLPCGWRNRKVCQPFFPRPGFPAARSST